MTPMDQQSTALLYGFWANTSGAERERDRDYVTQHASGGCIQARITREEKPTVIENHENKKVFLIKQQPNANADRSGTNSRAFILSLFFIFYFYWIYLSWNNEGKGHTWP